MFLSSVFLQASDITLYVEIFFIIILLIIFLALFASSIKIVREYERVVQFRLGRLTGSKGPGIVLILPVINRLVKVDLRERYLEVPHQTAITKDNAPVDIDFLIYYKVVDASASIVQVQNFTGASVGLATTTLRAVVGDIPLDELLSKREQINSILEERSYPASGRTKTVSDPSRRGQQAVPDSCSGWVCSSIGSYFLRCKEHRLENYGSPIPGYAQSVRRWGIDKVHPANGVHQHDFQTERICSRIFEGLDQQRNQYCRPETEP